MFFGTFMNFIVFTDFLVADSNCYTLITVIQIYQSTALTVRSIFQLAVNINSKIFLKINQ